MTHEEAIAELRRLAATVKEPDMAGAVARLAERIANHDHADELRAAAAGLGMVLSLIEHRGLAWGGVHAA